MSGCGFPVKDNRELVWPRIKIEGKGSTGCKLFVCF